jgi:hypothetical protein
MKETLERGVSSSDEETMMGCLLGVLVFKTLSRAMTRKRLRGLGSHEKTIGSHH